MSLITQLKQTEESIESSEGVFQQEIVSEAREKYQARYEGERELNETFSQFVFNYRAAFEGRNTMRDQIIDTTVSKRKLSDKICKSGANISENHSIIIYAYSL